MAGFKAVHRSNGWTMPHPGQAVKEQSAEIGGRGKSGRFGLSVNERLDELSDLVLLVARKLAGPLKNLPQLSRRAFATGF